MIVVVAVAVAVAVLHSPDKSNNSGEEKKVRVIRGLTNPRIETVENSNLNFEVSEVCIS